ncbi:SpoIIE family protein phosphatase [Streptomyces sp. NBC_01218]|uniref:GAF domain-containing SpoIIE family protein phosphatase n=1 Tax=unclassified Streptomyces TaxID=2593676 RepID=UPI0023B89554|nr:MULTISPECIES: GAF domain-containing SpoIIE family protein phosphatase [unclassified Streptomyces]WEH38826.1 SpoIIE family protein phosphatase [Streptomyces sp. AM 2-1-1]WSQ50488.1 SpoIIE family protein phosphatase [Streptomyces sp. NBC_01218]
MTGVPDQQACPPAREPAVRAAATDTDHDLRALFGQSMAVFASMAGPAHMLEAANPAFFTAIGGLERTRTGVPLGQLMPELVEQGFITLLDRVYRTAEAYTGRDARVVLGEGAKAREAYFDFTYEPRTDAGGNVMGVRMIGVETTQIKHAQRLTAEHRALLEQIARQAPLSDVLEGMARAIQDLTPEEVLVSVLLADADGRHLRHGAAPSLPDFYNQAIDGIATGEGVGSCGTAAHRRRPVAVSDIATDPFWDDYRDLADKAGLAACWSTPILASDGSLLGTFAMYHRVPRSPQDADLALAQIFADTAALAIERHQAEQAYWAAEVREKAARDDLAFLLHASTTLSAELDADHTLRRLADACVPRLAPLCAVDVIEGGRVHRVATNAPTRRQQDLLASHTPAYDTDDPITRVLASGVTEVARRAPTGPAPWQDLGVTGYLCIPLLDRGNAFGTVTLLYTGDHIFDGHTIVLAEELVARAALAARNARQYTHRAALARDLQAGLLLPDVPRVPGAEVATYYHPAGEGLDIGGDFYDVFPLEGDRWGFMLGDVCGRGAIAATTTALVRHTARAVAPLVPGPEAVVKAVNQALINRPAGHGTGFVTLVYGQLTPTSTGLDIDLVRAGHTLPLHMDNHHTVRTVDAPGILLGIGPDIHIEPRSLHLRPAESLMLYTDGITEARRHDDELFGDQRLADAVTGTPHRPTPQHLINAVTEAVHAFTGDHGIDDDQAILVLTAAEPG